MKIIYISLLSVAIVGQAGYFCYDYQAKKHQSELNDSFREQTAARVSQLETKTDNTLREVGAAVDDAVKSGAAQVKQQLEQRFAELQNSEALYEADLHKHEVQLQNLFTQVEQDMKQTSDQTNHVLS